MTARGGRLARRKGGRAPSDLTLRAWPFILLGPCARDMISDMTDPHRYPRPVTGEAMNRLSARFGLPRGPYDQDWEYTSADASRLGEFIDALEGDDLTDAERFTLSEIVMESFNDLMSMDETRAEPANWGRFTALLRARPKLHAFALCYWSALESMLEDAWHVTPLVRPLWAELQPLIDGPEPPRPGGAGG
jgi:hypothetical protein